MWISGALCEWKFVETVRKVEDIFCKNSPICTNICTSHSYRYQFIFKGYRRSTEAFQDLSSEYPWNLFSPVSKANSLQLLVKSTQMTGSKWCWRLSSFSVVLFKLLITLCQRQLLQINRQKFVRCCSFELRSSKACQSQFDVFIDNFSWNFYCRNFMIEFELIFNSNQSNIVVMAKWFIVSGGESKFYDENLY